MILFGTDGTNSPSQFHIPGTYISTFGPDISTSTNPLDKAIVAGVAKYGPYGAFGVPTYAATDVVMKAIASVCKAGQTPSRSNVLAAIKTTNIPAATNVLGQPISFTSNGNLSGQPGYLFHVNSAGQVHRDPTQVKTTTADGSSVRSTAPPANAGGAAASRVVSNGTGTCRSSSKQSSTD